MRWSEEVLFLVEEMWRVVTYHEWHADWWLQQATWWDGLPAERMEGLSAYAHRQASIRLEMRDRFLDNWRNVGTFVELGAGADNSVLDQNMETSP
jgi:hypothetical protein